MEQQVLSYDIHLVAVHPKTIKTDRIIGFKFSFQVGLICVCLKY